jgi:hypothetical protein
MLKEEVRGLYPVADACVMLGAEEPAKFSFEDIKLSA